VCEDLWKGLEAGFADQHKNDPDPVEAIARLGCDLLINPSASPFALGKGARHRELLRRHATAHGFYVAAVNQIGANDELIFDGHAAVYDPQGRLIAAGPGFTEHTLIVEIPSAGDATASDPLLTAPDEQHLFAALSMGIGDYLHKVGFSRAIIGLSGGIDSALTAVLAADALGPANVTGVAMPGPYSSEHSVTDAIDLAKRLGVNCLTIPIAEPFAGATSALDPAFAALNLSAIGASRPDLAEENLQSRLRGTLLMALSNRSGAVVLNTGNKSEFAVGYCTLYGDMNGALAVLSDVTKQQVYRLSRWINDNCASLGFARPPIPESTITKPPSAELAPDQKDEDSLPPYDVLDEVIERYVERRQSVSRIVREAGFDPAVVARIVRMIDMSEYKRKQAAIGLKVTSVAFGSGRRWPIAQRWRDDQASP
jgi:NAD+ synthase/NAD+ synthase (glutamine-hydrolysing)